MERKTTSTNRVSSVSPNELSNKKPDPGKKAIKASTRTLLQYASGWPLVFMVWAAVLQLVIGVLMIAPLFFFQSFFNTAGEAENLEQGINMGKVVETVTNFCLIGAGMMVCFFFSVWPAMLAAADQKATWKAAAVGAILRQEVAWFDVSNPEQLGSKITESVTNIYKALDFPTYMVFQGIGMGVSGFAFGFERAWDVALVVLCIIPVVLATFGAFFYVLFSATSTKTKAYAVADGLATESLFAMRTVAALGIEGQFTRNYIANLAAATAVHAKISPLIGFTGGLSLSSFLWLLVAGFLSGGFFMAAEMDKSAFFYTQPSANSTELIYCARPDNEIVDITVIAPAQCPPPFVPLQLNCRYMGFIGAGDNTSRSILNALDQENTTTFLAYAYTHVSPGYLSDNPALLGGCTISAAALLVAVFAMMNAGQGFGNGFAAVANYATGLVGAGTLDPIIRRVSLIDPFSEEGERPTTVAGEIEVRDVVFAYPSAPEHTVCNGYCLHVKAGQTVALCGASGSGKSTVIALLERFYDPQSGSVSLDGRDLKTLNVRWLRSQLGLVAQEPVLFQGSIADNISYGRLEPCTQEEIEEAAKMANAHDFIVGRLSDGYGTQVGQGGSKLSGGQKQRIAIARAVIKKPAVLLLDEATSALDTTSEKIVQSALDEIMAKQKRTTLVIAHRLSTIRNADKIAVVDKGVVVEQGSYDELLALGEDGHFFILARKQEEMGVADLAAIEKSISKHAEASTSAELDLVGVAKATSKGSKVSGEKVDSQANGEEDSLHGAVAVQNNGRRKEPSYAGKILRLQKESWWLLIFGCCFAVGSGGSQLFGFRELTKFFSALFAMSGAEVRTEVGTISLNIAIISAIMIVCYTVDSTMFGIASSRLTAKLRRHAYSAFMRQDIGFFDMEENSAGQLTGFLAEKVALIESLTGGSAQAFVRVLAALVVLIVLNFVYGPWQLALALLGALPCLLACMGLLTAVLMGDQLAAQKGKEVKSVKGLAEKSAGKLLGEVVLSIRTVASFNSEQRFLDDYLKGVETVRLLDRKAAFKAAIAMSISMPLFIFLIAGMYYYQGYLINIGQTNFERGMVPLLLLFGVMVPVISSISGLKDTVTANTAAKRFFEVTSRRTLIDPFSEEGERPTTVAGEIEVRDVVFAYPSAPEHTVCNGYCLHVKAGQTVALCGASGSGKSTVIALLERFYDPQSGSVSLDGRDLKTLNVRWLRSQLGLVAQEPVLFQGSIADNISYGRLEPCTQEEIEEAAKMANAHNFIMNDLNDRYASDVGLRGSKLSGGQKQRIAIARAVIKKPAVLLLDEATSALDNTSEKIVQSALDEIMAKQKRTTLVIAHRLSTIRDADKIAVVDKGIVVEEGSHDDLLSAPGSLYSNLVIAQSS